MALRTLWRRNGALLNNSHPTSEEVEYKLARDFGKTYQIAIIIQRSLVQYNIVLCMYFVFVIKIIIYRHHSQANIESHLFYLSIFFLNLVSWPVA